jgi:ribulose kinase
MNVLIDRARRMTPRRLTELGRDLHVLPDILGNRSPLADPSARAGIVGFGADTGPEALAQELVAAIQALACGTKHIVDALAEAGVEVRDIVVSGGLAKNPLYLSDTASVTGLPVLVPEVSEPVLLGGAILGKAASAGAPLAEVATGMAGGLAQTIHPAPEDSAYFARKYRVFRRMQQDEAAYRAIMNGKEF